MKKRKFILSICAFVDILIAFSIILGVVNEPKASFIGNTLYVGGNGGNNYSKIQDAMNNASNGDTIFVYSGIYYENVVIDKSISLIGENKETTIIDGSNAGDVALVTANGVTVQEFTIRNSGKLNAGVKMSFANDNSIYNCNISNNYYGIYAYYPYNDSIYNCSFTDGGIFIWGNNLSYFIHNIYNLTLPF